MNETHTPWWAAIGIPAVVLMAVMVFRLVPGDHPAVVEWTDEGQQNRLIWHSNPRLTALKSAAIHEGDHVDVSGASPTIRVATNPLIFGETLDLSHAGSDPTVLPGVGKATARKLQRRATPGESILANTGVSRALLARIDPLVTQRTHVDTPLLVNLSSARAAELIRLPGIGPVLAERILVDRREKGPYTTVHELQRVRGIGPQTVARLTPYVTLE